MEVDKQLKFKSHQRMQVEFISNNVDVMIHDFLSSVALALEEKEAFERNSIVTEHVNDESKMSQDSKYGPSCRNFFNHSYHLLCVSFSLKVSLTRLSVMWKLESC